MQEKYEIHMLSINSIKPFIKYHVCIPNKCFDFITMFIESHCLKNNQGKVGGYEKYDFSGENKNKFLVKYIPTCFLYQDDEILYCEGCGCYGMAGEFVAQNSCSNTCNNIIQARYKTEKNTV